VNQLTGAIPEQIDGGSWTADRTATSLGTAWLIKDGTGAPPSAEPLTRDAATPVPAAAKTPALVVLSDRVPAVARTAAAVIAAGGRAYCLAPAGWSSQQAPGWLTSAPATSILVRRVLEPPVAAVLSGRRGWIWAGPHGPGDWRLQLDPGQAEAMRLAFLELFWNRSDDEGWPQEGRLQWRARGEPPFDVPEPLSQDQVRLDAFAAPTPMPGSDGTLYSPDGQLPEQVPRRVWVPPSGEGPMHSRLAGATLRGSTVVWADLGLPTCTTGRHARLRPANASWSLDVRLTEEQDAALTGVLAGPPAAEFRVEVTLKEAADLVGMDGSIWRAGQDQEEHLIGQQALDAGTVAAGSLRDMRDAQPSSWPEPAATALFARYTWRISAPRPPADAKADPLVGKWQAVDRAFGERRAAALAKLAETKEEADALGQEFPDRRDAALGFGPRAEELQASLEGQQGAVPSVAGPLAARALLARLTELDAAVGKLTGEVATALGHARAEADRQRQQMLHNQLQEQARQDLTARRDEQAEQERRQAELDGRLGELALNSDGRPEKDLKAARGKLRDEQKAVTTAIAALRQQIDRAEAILARPFTYRPSTAPTLGRRDRRSLVPSATTSATLVAPDEALPAVGRLLRAGGERMLAISSWADLDQGEQEAARLDARLVAWGEDA